MLKKVHCRRYEDFTTIGLFTLLGYPYLERCSYILNVVDWIQDSILERNRRLRAAQQAKSAHRGPNGEITLPWIQAQIYKTFGAAQTWLVISLAGTLYRYLQTASSAQYYFRCLHRV